MADLILVRGVPGSGKSTFAKKMVDMMPSMIHLEADMFFVNDGQYRYDPTLIPAAHQWCRDRLKFHLEADAHVVVSNTFVRRWEIESYLSIVPSHTNVTVITVHGNWPNVHGVPQAVIRRMIANWETWPV